MGHTINIEHHQATDGLVNLFTKASHDLTVVQHRLEKEFQQVYPDNVNASLSLSLSLSIYFWTLFCSLETTLRM